MNHINNKRKNPFDDEKDSHVTIDDFKNEIKDRPHYLVTKLDNNKNMITEKYYTDDDLRFAVFTYYISVCEPYVNLYQFDDDPNNIRFITGLLDGPEGSGLGIKLIKSNPEYILINLPIDKMLDQLCSLIQMFEWYGNIIPGLWMSVNKIN